MNATHSSFSTRLKVGIFTLVGFLLVMTVTLVANNKPFWWRSCQLVSINIDDATGLKTKSPIRSLGIEIGYLKSVSLFESHVTLGICITAPVEVLPSTKAYIRGEGFLGDKFVELKPVKYLGEHSSRLRGPLIHSFVRPLMNLLATSAWASTPLDADEDKVASPPAVRKHKLPPNSNSREIPVGAESQDVQHLVNRVDEMVQQMTGLTDNLKQAIHPEELRSTMRQLNQTLQNASKTLAPEGGLNQTAQRTLAKLEDSIEQLRDQMTRVNKGEGSVGMLLNDPTYAEEIRLAIRNVNLLLNRVNHFRFVVDIGGGQLTGFDGGRGWFHLAIWPRPDRYYLLGVGSDSRGKISNMTVTTTAGGMTQVTQTQVVDQTGLLLTGMLGKVFFNNRLDLSVGALYGDAAASVIFNLGPDDHENRIQVRGDTYIRNAVGSVDERVTLSLSPLKGFYLRAGLESIRPYNGRLPFFLGAGLSFDDEDIKLLFALR